MKAPDKIYIDGFFLQYDDIEVAHTPIAVDIEYIRKDTLLNWAKTKLSHIQEDFDVYTGQRLILRELIEKIESL